MTLQGFVKDISVKFPVRVIKKRRKASWRHGLLQTDMNLHYLRSLLRDPIVKKPEKAACDASHHFLSLPASAATTRSPAANSLLCKTCNLSKPEPRWRPLLRTGRRVSRAFIESGSSWDAAEERERRILCRSRGGILGVHSNYSWRDTFSAPLGLTKATNWLGKMAHAKKKACNFISQQFWHPPFPLSP